MPDHFLMPQQVKEIAERRALRRAERRDFFRRGSGFAAGIAGGAILAACGGNSSDSVAQSAPPVSTGPSDADILNFALNLEYLEAQFYVNAATGVGLPATMLTGTGTQGAAGRSPGDVLNIVYLNPGAVSRGGFYPAGVNGSLALSSAFA